MENKQLERELRSIVQGLKGTEILKIIDLLQTEEAVVLNTNYTSIFTFIKNRVSTAPAAPSSKTSSSPLGSDAINKKHSSTPPKTISKL